MPGTLHGLSFSRICEAPKGAARARAARRERTIIKKLFHTSLAQATLYFEAVARAEFAILQVAQQSNMTTVVRKKRPIVVPDALRRKAGIKPGDRLQFKVSGGIIHIIPELPAADDNYTPEQRRIIDAEIAEAQKGPYYGPFNTVGDIISHMKGELKKRAAAKKANRRAR
jgi:AbrB family looped-hinge helix DNA binding protein